MDLVIRNLSSGAESPTLHPCPVLLEWLVSGEYLLCSSPSPPHGNLLELVPLASPSSRPLLRTQRPLMNARVSPDARWAAIVVDAGHDNLASGYAVPLDGDSSNMNTWVKIFDEPFNGSLHWAPDGNTLYFWKFRDGFRCLWGQKLHPASKHPLGEPIAILHRHAYQAYPTGGAGLAITSLPPTRFAMTLSDALSNIWRIEAK